jgi:hypothetical protein
VPDAYRTVPDDDSTKAAKIVAGAFLVAIAAFEGIGFRLSFQSLHAVAIENGVTPNLAWMFPALVDGGIVLGSIGVVRALAAGRATRPYWFVTIGFTLVSWAFNVTQAPNTLGGWAVATVAPLAQMVALELGMQELRALLLPNGNSRPAPAAPEPAAFNAEPSTPDPTAVPSDTQQQPEPEQQQPEQQRQQSDEEQQQGEQQEQQRQQRHRPVLEADTSSPWTELYEACPTEAARVGLTRNALIDRPKLNAPQWAVDIAKSETRARDLLREARQPHADEEAAMAAAT